MFENLTARLARTVDSLRGRGRITELGGGLCDDRTRQQRGPEENCFIHFRDKLGQHLGRGKR